MSIPSGKMSFLPSHCCLSSFLALSLFVMLALGSKNTNNIKSAHEEKKDLWLKGKWATLIERSHFMALLGHRDGNCRLDTHWNMYYCDQNLEFKIHIDWNWCFTNTGCLRLGLSFSRSDMYLKAYQSRLMVSVTNSFHPSSCVLKTAPKTLRDSIEWSHAKLVKPR